MTAKIRAGYQPPHPIEGQPVRINVILDEKAYEIAKRHGHNNVSAGLRHICKEYDREVKSKS